MDKIIKKVTLSTEQSTPKSVDPTKGTQTNPYTQVEMAKLQEEGTWNGGYVEGLGYIVPMMSVNSGSGIVPYVHKDNRIIEKDLPFDYGERCNPTISATINVEWEDGYPESYDGALNQALILSPISLKSYTLKDGILPFTFEDVSPVETVHLKVIASYKTQDGFHANWVNQWDGTYKIVGSLKYSWLITGPHDEPLVYRDGKYYLSGRELTNSFYSITKKSDDGTLPFTIDDIKFE